MSAQMSNSKRRNENMSDLKVITSHILRLCLTHESNRRRSRKAHRYNLLHVSNAKFIGLGIEGKKRRELHET